MSETVPSGITPEVNSPEFFGLTPGTPEYDEFLASPIRDLGNDLTEEPGDFVPSKHFATEVIDDVLLSIPGSSALGSTELAISRNLVLNGRDPEAVVTAFLYDNLL